MTDAKVKPDWTGLARAPFAPKRPQLARARAHLQPWFERERRERDEALRSELVREAWESCATAGLVPIEWLEGDRRWVQIVREHARTDRDRTLDLREPASTRVLDHPPDVPACLAMASDPEGALAAELLTERVRNALLEWSAPTERIDVVWRIDTLDPEMSAGLIEFREAGRDRLDYRVLYRAGERAFAGALGERAPQGWPLFIARLAKECAFYETLVEQGFTEASASGRVVPFAGRTNPLVHAAELFAMGYGVERSYGRRQLRVVARPPAF